MQEIKLNLGCSDDLKPGYVNVDSHIPYNERPRDLRDALFHSSIGAYNFSDAVVYVMDMRESWAPKNDSIDGIYAKDVFEHVDNASFPGNRGKIWVLNESYRVLKNGARLEMLVPCVHMRDMTINPGAFADPTHVSFWTYDDRYYFTEEWNNPQGERGRLGPAYGVTCRFKVIVWELQEYGGPGERRSKIHAVLEAVK